MGKYKRTKSDNFSEELKRDLFYATNGRCWYRDCLNGIDDFHHRVANRPENRIKFPRFIQSVYNAFPCCRFHHQNYAHEFALTDKQAEVYEKYLEVLCQKKKKED